MRNGHILMKNRPLNFDENHFFDEKHDYTWNYSGYFHRNNDTPHQRISFWSKPTTHLVKSALFWWKADLLMKSTLQIYDQIWWKTVIFDEKQSFLGKKGFSSKLRGRFFIKFGGRFSSKYDHFSFLAKKPILIKTALLLFY